MLSSPTATRSLLSPSSASLSSAGPHPDPEIAAVVASTCLSTGLSSAEVASRQQRYGRNESVERLRHPVLLFLVKFTGLSSFLLEAVVAIALGLQNYVDAVVVGALLIANAVLGLMQDLRARKAVQELKAKMQLQARVCRDGQWQTISAAEVVPGDVTRLRFGDSVSADCVLVQGECQVDQSALTGESELQRVGQHGLIYGGSMLKGGECTAVVVATGAATYYGRTVQLVQDSKPNVHVDRIVRNVSMALLAAVVVMLVIAVVVTASRGQSLVDIVTLLLVLLVSAIPVALPAMFTVSMAIGSKELVRHDVLVTRLNATEDCASMTVLCCDKTGTLTLNQLTVENAWLNPLCRLRGGHGARGRLSAAELLRCAALCSRVENHDAIDQAVLAADATHRIAPEQSPSSASSTRLPPSPRTDDSAEVNLSQLLAVDRSAFAQQSFLPFDASTRRTESEYEVSLPSASSPDGAARFRLVVCKGAANTLLELCGCSDAERAVITQRMDQNAARGHRSLAVAASLQPADAAAPRLHLLGVISLYDPPRPDSASVLRQLKALGVQVKMLTGDSRAVAVETARVLDMGTQFVNIHHPKDAQHQHHAPAEQKTEAKVEIVTEAVKEPTEKEAAIAALPSPAATSPPAVSPAAAAGAAEAANGGSEFRYDWLTADGFAEVFPADKHSIVSAMQKAGHIVGMTGDGVNDSPSLKQAEVGVAVSNATDVAKAAASVILLTEGLSGILILIRVGRSIHRRIVTWIVNKISKTLQTTLFVVVSFFITGSFPITAFDMVLLLLLIDFVTISLATDRVRVSPQPERWDIPRLTRIAAVIGVMSAGQAVGLLMAAVYGWQLSDAQVNTFSFELLYFFGICTTFIAREDRWFFSSLPSPLLIAVCAVEGAAVVAVCSVGVPELTGIAFWQAIIVPVYAAGCSFLLNDPCKVLYYRWAARSSTPLQGLQAVEMSSAPTTSPEHSLHVDVADRAQDQTALRVSV